MTTASQYRCHDGKSVEDMLAAQLKQFEGAPIFQKTTLPQTHGTVELEDEGTTFTAHNCTGLEVTTKYAGHQLSDLTDMTIHETTLNTTECGVVAGWFADTHLDDLETLDLSFSTLPADGVNRILNEIKARKKRCALEILKLDGCTRPTQETIDCIAGALASAPNIFEVSLGSLFIDDADIIGVSQGCVNSDGITTLILDDNRIGPEGALRLREMMRGTFSLKTLEVSHNRLVGEGAVALLESLPFAPHVTSLGLGANGIHTLPDINASCLADSQLRSLSLRDNFLGVQGTISLCNVLRATESLTALYLNGNKLGSDGLCVLLATLANSENSIKCLDISSNEIGPGQACIDLSQFIADPGCKLLKMDLSYNPIGDDGLFILDEAFPKATSLRFIVLQNCGIKETTTYEVELTPASPVQQVPTTPDSEGNPDGHSVCNSDVSGGAVGDDGDNVPFPLLPTPVLQIDIDEGEGSDGSGSEEDRDDSVSESDND